MPTDAALPADAALERLPLFPLGTVLLPGLLLPLHVFEERYRRLVRDLLALPEQSRRFGVVAIRSGREVGSDGVRALHEVGCVAHLRRVVPYEDGRFEIATTGTHRFRIARLLDDAAYPSALVEPLADELGAEDEAARLDPAVRAAFGAYSRALAEVRGEPAPELVELPSGTLALSYRAAAGVVVDLEERQRLLAAVDGVARLRAALALLRRESTLLRTLTATPAPELTRAAVSPN